MNNQSDPTEEPFPVTLDSDEVRRVIAALRADTSAAERDGLRALLTQRLNQAHRPRTAGVGPCGVRHG